MKMINKIKCRIAHELHHRLMKTPSGDNVWSCGKCGHGWEDTGKPLKMAVFDFFIIIGMLWIVAMAYGDLT